MSTFDDLKKLPMRRQPLATAANVTTHSLKSFSDIRELISIPGNAEPEINLSNVGSQRPCVLCSTSVKVPSGFMTKVYEIIFADLLNWAPDLLSFVHHVGRRNIAGRPRQWKRMLL